MVWTGVTTFLLYCWGLIETYSAYLDTTSLIKGYQLYSNLFFTARNGLFYTPVFIYMGYYLYDHFMYKPLGFTVGKKWPLPLDSSV